MKLQYFVDYRCKRYLMVKFGVIPYNIVRIKDLLNGSQLRFYNFPQNKILICNRSSENSNVQYDELLQR